MDLSWILTVGYALTMIFLLITLFMERTDPKRVFPWILLVAFIPLVGFVLYLLFGQTFYDKKRFSLKSNADSKMENFAIDEVKEIREEMAKGGNEDSEEMKFISTMIKTTGAIYTEANDVRLYTDGNKKFSDMFDDIRNAKSFIHIEYYIIRNDKLSNELMDILISKVKEGVKVRLMIDAIGNNKGPKKKLFELMKIGGEVEVFHSLAAVLLSPKKNNRNHRKIAVIDGLVGYVGGFNIGDEYLGKGPFGNWRDSAVRVVGNGVIMMNLRFIMDWKYANGKNIPFTGMFHFYSRDETESAGMQIISGGPDTLNNPIQKQYLMIINQAKERLYIQTPYLGPDQSIVDALTLCVSSGVDVRIMIPDKRDHPFVYWNTRYWASVLIEAGAKVYCYNNGFLHAKTVVSDGKYCSVGSSNLDERSLSLNFETNAMIYSYKIGKEMEDAFTKDLEDSTEYTAEMYNSRTHIQRMKTTISKIFGSLL